jgi:hypothetical protein
MKRLLTYSRRYRLRQAIKKTAGLVGYYPLNEISGTIAVNNALGTIGQYNGIIAGSPLMYQPGKLGPCISFDASNDTIAVSSFAINSHNAKSFVCVTNGGAANTNPTGFGSSGTARTGLSFQATGLIRLELPSSVASSTIRITSPNNSFPLNTWGMVGYSNVDIADGVARVITDGDIYINGVVQTKSSALVGAAAGIQTKMNLGSYADNSGFLNGKLQHAAYFNRVLNASEFRRLAHKAGFV